MSVQTCVFLYLCLYFVVLGVHFYLAVFLHAFVFVS